MSKEDYTYYSTETTTSYKNSADGDAVQRKDKLLNWQWDNTVSYKTLIADKHSISAILGTNMSYYSYNWSNIDVRGFDNDFFLYKAIAGASKKEFRFLDLLYGFGISAARICVRQSLLYHPDRSL